MLSQADHLRFLKPDFLQSWATSSTFIAIDFLLPCMLSVLCLFCYLSFFSWSCWTHWLSTLMSDQIFVSCYWFLQPIYILYCNDVWFVLPRCFVYLFCLCELLYQLSNYSFTVDLFLLPINFDLQTGYGRLTALLIIQLLVNCDLFLQPINFDIQTRYVLTDIFLIIQIDGLRRHNTGYLIISWCAARLVPEASRRTRWGYLAPTR